jgi:proline iminopeptidase
VRCNTCTALEEDFSVVYLDTRGSGRSEAPEKVSGFKFQNFLADIENLRTHLNLDRWLIFAHSDASLQALGYAIEHPRLCHGLFIVGGTLNIEDKEWQSDIRARRKKLSRASWFAATNKPSPQTDDRFRRNFLDVQLPLYFCSAVAAKTARHYFSASTYRVKGNKYDDYAPRFPSTRLAKIRAPTAVFVGDGDVITTPLEAIRLQRGIANAMLFVITGAGHFPWLQQRAAFFRGFCAGCQDDHEPQPLKLQN